MSEQYKLTNPLFSFSHLHFPKRKSAVQSDLHGAFSMSGRRAAQCPPQRADTKTGSQKAAGCGFFVSLYEKLLCCDQLNQPRPKNVLICTSRMKNMITGQRYLMQKV